MKAEELMIGDKVRITDVETNMEKQRGVFATVCKIEKEGNYWSLTVMPDNDKHTYFIEREEEFEFVPLTPEILEKNGWRQEFDKIEYMVKYDLRNEGKNCWMMWAIKEHNLDVQRQDEKLDIYNLKVSRVDIPCDYVHELQHALRLCGIEKEIVV